MKLELSVDDGYPLDLKLAHELRKIDVTATFYSPAKNIEGLSTLSTNEIRTLHDLGHEIGGHTYNHRYLHTLADNTALDEIRSGLNYLEDIISQKVTKFCLPGGKFPRNMNIFDGLGISHIRTTRNMNFSENGRIADPSYQYYPHRKLNILANSFKQKRFDRIKNSFGFCHTLNSAFLPVATEIKKVFGHNQVIHVWCHSWELERYNLVDAYLDHVKRLKSL